MNSYTTALSHLVLTGTGIYCLAKISEEKLSFPHIAFILIIVNNFLGVWRYGNPQYGHKIYKIFKVTKELQDLFVSPCIVSILWLNYHYMLELSYAHITLSILTFFYVMLKKKSYKVKNLIIAINICSLCVVSLLNDNHYGLAAALSYAFNLFLLNEGTESLFDIPTQDLYNYAKCFFLIFSLQAIQD